MARVRMVTRAIDMTTVEVMTLNVTTADVKIETVKLTGIFTDAEALKAVKKEIETDELKAVHIQSTTVTQKLYGMLESDFLKLAKELDEKRNFLD